MFAYEFFIWGQYFLLLTWFNVCSSKGSFVLVFFFSRAQLGAYLTLEAYKHTPKLTARLLLCISPFPVPMGNHP